MTLTVVVLLLVSALAAWLMWRTLHRVEQAATLTKTEEQADLGSVVTRVRSLARLETASMHVANVSTIRQGYNLLPDRFAGDEITLFAAGDVIAGIDLSPIQQRDVWREPDGTLVMRLPPSQVLVSRLDNRETRVITRKTGIFRSADQGLEGRARQYAEQQIRNEAVRKNILGMAQEGAETKLAPLLHTLGFTKVRFERSGGQPSPAAPQ
ncbi:MAG TPA: DUF4230 domain-containing protein [Thermoanaerobaculia bacterium]|nr:DUF4230 domain-containing protein [Thermoanaerobaculia bacterium]